MLLISLLRWWECPYKVGWCHSADPSTCWYLGSTGSHQSSRAVPAPCHLQAGECCLSAGWIKASCWCSAVSGPQQGGLEALCITAYCSALQPCPDGCCRLSLVPCRAGSKHWALLCTRLGPQLEECPRAASCTTRCECLFKASLLWSSLPPARGSDQGMWQRIPTSAKRGKKKAKLKIAPVNSS